MNWGTEHNVLRPDERDDGGGGETQFYAMDGFLRRGDLLIGMVKVLRDDLKANPPPGPSDPTDPPDAYGVGYTALAWTRDGKTWTRDREVFFDRHPEMSAWDHSHAWVDEQLPVGDDVFLYYGGYKRGHKANRFDERQIGLVRMKQDRYVARVAGETTATLRTVAFVLDAAGLTLNAQVQSPGEIRIRLVDESGAPLEGFNWADITPAHGDGVRLPVRFPKPLNTIGDQPVRLEFQMKHATLYGFSAAPS